MVPEVLVAHLRRIRSHPEQGDLKYKRLMCDLESYERDFNFKILPDVARIDKNISVFSEQEAKADSIANSKFNKKFRKKIYE